jgi:cytochrome c-type biogenesis protein CcmH/NrfG
MHYTLRQASDTTGKDRSTLLRAIKSGKLSAIRQNDKSYLIDGAELSRVYPLPMRTSENAQDLPRHAQADAQGAQMGSALLNSMEELRVREIRRLEETIADMRTERDRLLRVIEEQANTVKQLTHQPTPKDKATYWWWFWAAVVLTVITLAATALFWPVLQQASVIYGHDEKTPQAQQVKPNEAIPAQPPSPNNLDRWHPDDNGG